MAPSEASFYDTLGNAEDVVVSEGRAYVADGRSGLAIIDVSDPAAPRELGRFSPPDAEIRGISVIGSRAYLAAGRRGVRIVDVSDPANPKDVGGFDTPRDARAIHVSGSLVYVGDAEWLRVYDVSKPSRPLEEAAHQTPGARAHAIWVTDTTAYVAGHQAGLLIFDVVASAPASPARETSGRGNRRLPRR